MSAAVPDLAEGHAPLLPGQLAPGGDVNRAACVSSEADSPGGSGAPPINLLTSVSDGRASGAIPDKWKSGVCWDPIGCAPSCIWPHSNDPLNEDNGGPITYPTDENGDRFKTVTDVTRAYAFPFDIAHGINEGDCRTKTAEQVAARAQRELAANTPVQVANYLSVSLANVATALPGTSAVPISTAVGLLMEARSIDGGSGGGVIHIPDIAVGAAQSELMLTRGGTRYTSIYGAPVVVGPGLKNINPDTGLIETEVGVAWLYVSGAVDYALDPIETISNQIEWDQARQNQIRKVIVERRALVRHDPCGVHAVRVSLPSKAC